MKTKLAIMLLLTLMLSGCSVMPRNSIRVTIHQSESQEPSSDTMNLPEGLLDQLKENRYPFLSGSYEAPPKTRLEQLTEQFEPKG